MSCTLLLLVLLLNINFCVHGWNYCRNQSFVCVESNKRHFSCTGELVPQATFVTFLPMTWRMRDVFLELHNELRDSLASGKVRNNKTGQYYPPAARLHQLVWDRELEYIAHLHARNCHNGPTKCHCSSKFQNVGENIGFVSSNTVLSYAAVNKSLHDMIHEKDLVRNTMEMAETFNAKENAAAAHFITIIQDQAYRVGCALAHCTNGTDENLYYMACYYNHAPLNGLSVYEIGKPVSACADWGSKPSESYKHLCENNGADVPKST